MVAAKCGPPPTTESRGQNEPHPVSTYHYPQQDSIKARRLMAAISGPHPTTESRGPPEQMPEVGNGILYLYHLPDSIKALLPDSGATR